MHFTLRVNDFFRVSSGAIVKGKPCSIYRPPLQLYFSPNHEQFRATLRDFVAREITPFVNEWDEAATFPRSLCKRATEIGALGVGYP